MAAAAGVVPLSAESIRATCRPCLLAAGVVAIAASPGSAADSGVVLRWLAGRWTGPGMTLSIDPERMQANFDPNKPFQWDALRLRDVTGCMVTFNVGARRFVALMFAGRVMHINSVNVVGEQSLQGEPDGASPAIDCPAEPDHAASTDAP